MTTPAPVPSGAQSGSGVPYMDPSLLTLPDVGGASKGSPYGLSGAVANMPINVGSLLHINKPPGQITANDVMEAFAHADPGTIAQIQSYLYKGGNFYKSGTQWSDINIGVLNPDDLDAFRKAVDTAAQTSADLSDYLRRQAAFGVYQGVSGRVIGRTGGVAAAAASGQALRVETPNPMNLVPYIEEEYKKLTGRKPTASEKAGFVAAYTAAYRQIQVDNYTREYAAANAAAGTGPGAASSAPPGYEKLVGSSRNVAGGLGKSYVGKLTPAEQAQQELNYSVELGLPDMGVANLIAGGIPSEVNVRRAAENAKRYAQDQQFLALADQPMPGMPGYGTGGAAAASSFQTVQQEQNFDPAAFAENYVRTHAVGEAGGHDAANTFDMFLNILRG